MKGGDNKRKVQTGTVRHKSRVMPFQIDTSRARGRSYVTLERHKSRLMPTWPIWNCLPPPEVIVSLPGGVFGPNEIKNPRLSELWRHRVCVFSGRDTSMEAGLGWGGDVAVEERLFRQPCLFLVFFGDLAWD